ncbi:hypothetical protein [Pseudomonas sp. BN515]|uniref:hypothetical protein n=1 Tax=Pseudomonas sp. BN515 TaxID=2567892 RepID=UPI002453CD4B|nr:hypothetical protein [Pseudomonas sp. BN515]MDH4873036.1 hypothetical protein [Pseudomonas sp. BN515]
MNKLTAKQRRAQTASDRAFYIQRTLTAIRADRETKLKSDLESPTAFAHGMVSAGLFLKQLSASEYDLLWDLASNARKFRRRELQHNQPLYTWKEQPAIAQEAAA